MGGLSSISDHVSDKKERTTISTLQSIKVISLIIRSRTSGQPRLRPSTELYYAGAVVGGTDVIQAPLTLFLSSWTHQTQDIPSRRQAIYSADGSSFDDERHELLDRQRFSMR